MKKFRVRVNGNEYEVEVEEIGASSPQEPVRSSVLTHPNRPAALAIKDSPRPVATPVTTREGSELISAPMPGTILDVRVQAGEKVRAGQILMILEAMKMENEILAPRECTVSEIHAVKGTSVNAGDALIVLA